jgi:hypothetical protein
VACCCLENCVGMERRHVLVAELEDGIEESDGDLEEIHVRIVATISREAAVRSRRFLSAESRAFSRMVPEKRMRFARRAGPIPLLERRE